MSVSPKRFAVVSHSQSQAHLCVLSVVLQLCVSYGLIIIKKLGNGHFLWKMTMSSLTWPTTSRFCDRSGQSQDTLVGRHTRFPRGRGNRGKIYMTYVHDFFLPFTPRLWLYSSERVLRATYYTLVLCTTQSYRTRVRIELSTKMLVMMRIESARSALDEDTSRWLSVRSRALLQSVWFVY